MEDDDDYQEIKAELRPRRPGENLKVAKTVLKRKDMNLTYLAQRAAEISKLKKAKKQYEKGFRIARPETILRQARLRKFDERRIKQLARRRKWLPSEQGGNVYAVVRNGRRGGCWPIVKTLKALNLTRRYSLVFLPKTAETLEKLRVVEPFVYWGTPTFKTICTLIQKKALFSDPDSPNGRTVLSDNNLVEKHLGDLGLLCTEDVADAIFNQTKGFPEVAKRLLSIPVGDLKQAYGLTREKEVHGEQLDGINERIAALLGE